MKKALSMLAATMAVVACTTTSPKQTGTSYQCDNGTVLHVNYVGDGALVRVDRGRTFVLRPTPSNSGMVYENRNGARLQRNGNDVTWNTAARMAPQQCRAMITPL